MKRLLLLAVACTLLLSCSNDDDGTNNNCSKPENISIEQINSMSVFFSWDTGGESAFEFEYGESGFSIGSGTVVQTSQTEFLVDGLNPLTAYEIFLRSNCGSDGLSDYISAQFTTLENVELCNTPTNLALVSVSSTTAELTWDENNETAWEIEYGPQGFVLGTGTTIQTSQSNFEIQDLTPSTTYEIYVRANCGSDGFSDYSDQLVVTTDS
ncbi:MAG: fibronectin type III domain-containing protein [Flavobacteriaceae bacterium]|nr:fibronectin type III domain-containing protein [Flavobacteriaceae bacterium]